MAGMKISYNKERDILYVSLRKSSKTLVEGTPRLIKEIDPKSGEVVGYMIFNFSKRDQIKLPLK